MMMLAQQQQILSGTVEVVTSGTVDTDTVGEYTLTYTSTDASGNAGTATRTVNVTDTTSPVFTSSSTFTVDENITEIGTSYCRLILILLLLQLEQQLVRHCK